MPDIFKDTNEMSEDQLREHQNDKIRAAIQTLLLAGYRIFTEESEIVPDTKKCGTWKFFKRETP